MFKLLKNLLFLGVTICAICLILLTGAAYFAFSEGPAYEGSSYNFNTMKAVSEFNYKFYTEGFLSSSSSLKMLTLTKDEINAAFMFYTAGNIVASLFNANREKQYDNLKLNSGNFNDGEFTLCLTQKVPYKIPFGSYLNFNIKTVPEIKNNKLSLKINAFKVGKLIIPSQVLNFILRIEDDKINSFNEVKILLNAVKELKTQSNSILIVYYPDRLSGFLSSDFMNSFR